MAAAIYCHRDDGHRLRCNR